MIIHPVKALGHGKKCPHQFFLAAQRDIDMTISHARADVRVRGTIHAVHCEFGTLVAVKLSKAGHSLAGGALHDDVDRA